VIEDMRLLNMRSGVMHRYPAFEACNIDAIPLQFRVTFKAHDRAINGIKRSCKRCFPEH
jgi:hypothetical protein